MRVRDKHFVFAELALTAIALFACCLSVYSTLIWSRRVRADVSALESRIDSAERLCVDAVGAAQALAESGAVAPSDDSIDSNPPSPVKVEGYGQGRTPKRRYVYRDTRLSDGTLKRDIVAWFPLNYENTP